jgi:hypothetical protein
MRLGSAESDKRHQDRMKAVLPVKVRGSDADGRSFEELAHTLDLTPTGARLGSIHHELKELDRLVVLYRQRKMEFRVVWTKRLGTAEYQVGLQALTQDKEGWGLNLSDFKVRQMPMIASPAVSQATGA